MIKWLQQLLISTIIILVVQTIGLVSSTSAADIQYDIKNFPLQSNGLNLHLDRMTISNTTASKDILLIHGLTYSSRVFDVDYKDYSLARYLARQGYNVWLLDITGYGQSDKPAEGFLVDSDYAAEDIHAAVDYILKLNGNKKVDILGWSWGTVTTSRFVAKYPEKVNKLVLYSPIFTGLGESEVQESYHQNTWENAAEDFQTDENGIIDYTVTEPGVVATFLSNCWRCDGASSPNGGRRDLLISEDYQLISINQLKVPVLIIEGNADPYINRKALQAAISTSPANSAFVEIAGGSHIVMLEKAYYNTFRNAVKKFLES